MAIYTEQLLKVVTVRPFDELTANSSPWHLFVTLSLSKGTEGSKGDYLCHYYSSSEDYQKSQQ